MDDIKFMKRALTLAKKGAGHVNPNPLVGAVIVKNGEIIGEGYHEQYGKAHAEVNAFNSCTVSPKGATMYVTLEPCSHHGKTPPCADAVVANGISRLVVGSIDENPLVSSINKIRGAGIEIVTGVLKEECDAMNGVFFHYIKTKTPYVIMKYAMTADGKIATYTGASRWITGELARKRVHEDRNLYTGIMVGVGTVLADDPMLDCRIKDGRNPIRIICDTTLKTPLDSCIVQTAREIPTWIATTNEYAAQYEPYLSRGCKIITVHAKEGHVDLGHLMIKLGELGMDSVLLEGGATLNASALEARIVNKVQTYLAPKLFGGMAAPTPVAGIGVAHPDQAYLLKNRKITTLGEDVLIESEVVKCLQEL